MKKRVLLLIFAFLPAAVCANMTITAKPIQNCSSYAELDELATNIGLSLAERFREYTNLIESEDGDFILRGNITLTNGKITIALVCVDSNNKGAMKRSTAATGEDAILAADTVTRSLMRALDSIDRGETPLRHIAVAYAESNAIAVCPRFRIMGFYSALYLPRYDTSIMRVGAAGNIYLFNHIAAIQPRLALAYVYDSGFEVMPELDAPIYFFRPPYTRAWLPFVAPAVCYESVYGDVLWGLRAGVETGSQTAGTLSFSIAYFYFANDDLHSIEGCFGYIF